MYAEKHKDDIENLDITDSALDGTIRLEFLGQYAPYLTLRQFLGCLFENHDLENVSSDDMSFDGVDYIVIKIKGKGKPGIGLALKQEMNDLFVNYIVRNNRGYPVGPGDFFAVRLLLDELCNRPGGSP